MSADQSSPGSSASNSSDDELTENGQRLTNAPESYLGTPEHSTRDLPNLGPNHRRRPYYRRIETQIRESFNSRHTGMFGAQMSPVPFYRRSDIQTRDIYTSDPFNRGNMQRFDYSNIPQSYHSNSGADVFSNNVSNIDPHIERNTGMFGVPNLPVTCYQTREIHTTNSFFLGPRPNVSECNHRKPPMQISDLYNPGSYTQRNSMMFGSSNVSDSYYQRSESQIKYSTSSGTYIKRTTETFTPSQVPEFYYQNPDNDLRNSSLYTNENAQTHVESYYQIPEILTNDSSKAGPSIKKNTQTSNSPNASEPRCPKPKFRIVEAPNPYTKSNTEIFEPDKMTQSYPKPGTQDEEFSNSYIQANKVSEPFEVPESYPPKPTTPIKRSSTSGQHRLALEYSKTSTTARSSEYCYSRPESQIGESSNARLYAVANTIFGPSKRPGFYRPKPESQIKKSANSRQYTEETQIKESSKPGAYANANTETSDCSIVSEYFPKLKTQTNNSSNSGKENTEMFKSSCASPETQSEDSSDSDSSNDLKIITDTPAPSPINDESTYVVESYYQCVTPGMALDLHPELAWYKRQNTQQLPEKLNQLTGSLRHRIVR